MNCAAFGLEVLSVSLEFVPVVTPEDSDGDLFLDALELALFGDLSQNGFGDADGDGYSNAEEQFVGTDPKNPLSFPPVAPANLGPPQMFVQTQPGSGTLSITWFWPAAYASKVNFQVLSTSTLGVPFTPSSLTPTQAGRGRFEVIIQVNPGPPNAPATQFFQLLMSLK
jgi:hypothetical protein